MSYAERAARWERHKGEDYDLWGKPAHIVLISGLFGKQVAKKLWMFEEIELSSGGRRQYEPNKIENVDCPDLYEMAKAERCPYCGEPVVVLGKPYRITNKGRQGLQPGVDVQCQNPDCIECGGTWEVV